MIVATEAVQCLELQPSTPSFTLLTDIRITGRHQPYRGNSSDLRGVAARAMKLSWAYSTSSCGASQSHLDIIARQLIRIHYLGQSLKVTILQEVGQIP